MSVQKCVRTPDIEDVGKTTRHGTFFEMCGNFSFGDYFKEGAIELGWDLVTKSRRRRRLRASRRAGSGRRSCTATTRRSSCGGRSPGCPTSGSSGWARRRTTGRWACPAPGGPCSEILYDRGPDYGPDGDFETMGTDMPPELEDRYLEFWNLVFMQDELSAVRSKEDFDIVGSLPKKNIDTGMGLERVAFLLQGVENMYEIDVMFPVIEKARSSPAAGTAPTTTTTSGSGSSPTTSAAR